MIFNLGDQFVYPSDTYDYGWYGILTIQRITENWVYLKSEYTGYDAEYRTFDDRDLMFPIDDFRGMVRRGKVLPYRENPAKCNDGSFSNSPHNSKGTCTWHEGVKGSATQSEYDASQMRVRYRSPKGYTGAFAPKKGKSATKPKPKARTQRRTQRRTQVYAIDVKSFNAQYDKSYKTKNNMGLVIAMALYDMGNPEYTYKLPLVNFTLEDAYNVANMDYEDAKAFVVHNVLPQWERTYNVHQSEEWNENEIQEIFNKYFDNVEKFFKNKRNIGQAKTILEKQLASPSC